MTVLTIYTIAALITAYFLDWNVYKRQILLMVVVAGWIVSISKSRPHETRAKFIALMCWINYLVFALSTDNFISIFSVMAGVIVLMAIFYIPQILYMGLVVPVIVFIYHIFIAKTVAITSLYEFLRIIMQMLSVYTVSAVVWIMIRSHQEANEALMQNISELKLLLLRQMPLEAPGRCFCRRDLMILSPSRLNSVS